MEHLPLIREAIAERHACTAPHHVVRPVFIGRDVELRVLDEELARAMAGEGRVALVVGDEGIGKTSLALEMSRLARDRGCTVLWGQCHETGGTPAYWPWVQILRRHAKMADLPTLRDDLGASAAALGWISPTIRERCPELPTADTSELTRFHVVDAVTQFLRRVAARRPLVLVLDDLQRADGDSLHLLRFFATETTDAPILVLGAYRGGATDGTASEQLAGVAGQPWTTVLRLGGFDVAEVRRYVEAATTVRPPGALAEAIHAKTAGHPLFVAEIARLLATEGRLSEDPTNGGFRIAVPDTRWHAIADRLARLSEPCRRLLGVAAVVGYSFGSELAAATGEEPHVVRETLREAIDQQIVTTSDDEPGTYRFAHALIWDVLYGSISSDDLRSLHARVAKALIMMSEEGGSASHGSEALLAAIAHHSVEAARCTADLTAALDWTIAAGDRAAAMMAHEEAARHYTVALRVAERAGVVAATDLSTLWVRLAEARWRAGDMNGAREAGRRALALAKENGEPAAIAVAALTFAGRLPGFGAVVSDPEVVSELEQALAILPRTLPALRAQVMARLAEELAYSPRRRTEHSLAQKAIELAHGVEDSGVLAAVLRTTQWSVWTPDDVERRRQLAVDIVALAARTGDRVLALDGELLRLWSALEHGETDLAWRQLEHCTDVARELRLPHYVWVTAAARACLHIAAGRLDDAKRLAERAAVVGERTGNLTVMLFVGVQREHVRLLRGGFDEVAEWLESVLTTFPVIAPAVECTFVVTHACAGQHDRARAELATFVADDFARVPRNAAWLMNMTSLATACVAVGDRATARMLYHHLAPFTPYNVVLPPALVTAPVSHYMGRLAGLMGNEVAARRHYEDALELEQRTGSRQWIAITQIAYGCFLRHARSPTDVQRGVQLIASGRAIAAELGLEPIVFEADAALAAPSRRAPARGAFRRVGDVWEIEFRGESRTVPHRVGLTYLRCLLERPGVPVPAIELASLGGDRLLVDHNGGWMIDRRAMADVQRRIAELDATIAACERRGAVASADLAQERAECVRYLGGRGTELVSAADRARSGVTKAIGRAIRAIAQVHESLAHHLDRHVETGRLCTYVPDPGAPITFDL